MASLFTNIQSAAHSVKNKISTKKDTKLLHVQEKLHEYSPEDFVDLNIKFIGASGLPKMDVVGSADPFFVATLDNQIKFTSSVKNDTLAPIWNECWRIKSVPKHATLEVEVWDRDEGTPLNDYIGKFKVDITPGAKNVDLTGPALHLRRQRGNFWLEIQSKPATEKDPKAYPYDFDGPIRYSRHISPTVGKLTNTNEARLYSTWKMYLKHVRQHFNDQKQHWNEGYKAAQTIFKGPQSIPVRTGVRAAHDLLYSRSSANGFGVVDSPADILSILHGGGASRPNQQQSEVQTALAHRVRPAIYTYVISTADDSFRFSETGAAFLVDFASKHALHSRCAQSVWYSGEFHPRPKGGWEKFSDDMSDADVEWELYIDNNSGTYAPNKAQLPQLQKLMEYNFPGFTIRALDREDPDLKPSVDACRQYAVKKRQVSEDELQPTLSPGEDAFSHRVWELWKMGAVGQGRKADIEDGDEWDEEGDGTSRTSLDVRKSHDGNSQDPDSSPGQGHRRNASGASNNNKDSNGVGVGVGGESELNGAGEPERSSRNPFKKWKEKRRESQG